MTIVGWVIFGVCVIFAVIVGFAVVVGGESKTAGILTTVIIVAVSLSGLLFYFNGTASGRRELVDQKSELENGLQREINVCNMNGDVLRHYEGKIDLEDNNGGYVIFDYEGKRYTYYNAFVESIADID